MVTFKQAVVNGATNLGYAVDYCVTYQDTNLTRAGFSRDGDVVSIDYRMNDDGVKNICTLYSGDVAIVSDTYHNPDPYYHDMDAVSNVTENLLMQA